MAYINNILIVGLLMLCSCKNQAQPYQLSKEPYNIVYGQWKHVYHEWHQYGKLNTVQVDSLKHVLFKIGKDKAYFENISFIDTCSFSTSDIKISKLFDKANKWEYSWYEDGEQFLLRPKDVGPLIYRYTKEELSEINKIELGAFESYTGTGSITKELKLTGKETTLKLSYEFYKEADELIVYDQNGKELDRTGMQATTKEVTETINIYDVTKLVFKIESKEANSKWKFSVMVE
jgi:hypothetical protein